jgi:hypothetical protein
MQIGPRSALGDLGPGNDRVGAPDVDGRGVEGTVGAQDDRIGNGELAQDVDDESVCGPDLRLPAFRELLQLAPELAACVDNSDTIECGLSSKTSNAICSGQSCPATSGVRHVTNPAPLKCNSAKGSFRIPF